MTRPSPKQSTRYSSLRFNGRLEHFIRTTGMLSWHRRYPAVNDQMKNSTAMQSTPVENNFIGSRYMLRHSRVSTLSYPIISPQLPPTNCIKFVIQISELALTSRIFQRFFLGEETVQLFNKVT